MFHEANEALINLANATSSDRKALETLTNTVANLTQQLKDKSDEIDKLKYQLKTKRPTKPNATRMDNGSYCRSHGYLIAANHNSDNCKFQKPGHKQTATPTNPLNGSLADKPGA